MLGRRLPGGTTDKYYVWSVTKTFGALLFGLVNARTSLSDEDPVTRWLKPGELGAINPQARMAHVLSMVATNRDLAHGKKGAWSYDTFGDREIDHLVPVMNRAIAAEPTRFGGAEDLATVAQRELFDRLGMRRASWVLHRLPRESSRTDPARAVVSGLGEATRSAAPTCVSRRRVVLRVKRPRGVRVRRPSRTSESRRSRSPGSPTSSSSRAFRRRRLGGRSHTSESAGTHRL